MNGVNYVMLSGTVTGEVTQEHLSRKQIGPLVRFTVALAGDASAGGAQDVQVPIVALGARAKRCLDLLGDGSRIVVFGRLTEEEGGALACFADWVEFVAIRRQRLEE